MLLSTFRRLTQGLPYDTILEVNNVDHDSRAMDPLPISGLEVDTLGPSTDSPGQKVISLTIDFPYGQLMKAEWFSNAQSRTAEPFNTVRDVINKLMDCGDLDRPLVLVNLHEKADQEHIDVKYIENSEPGVMIQFSDDPQELIYPAQQAAAKRAASKLIEDRVANAYMEGSAAARAEMQIKADRLLGNLRAAFDNHDYYALSEAGFPVDTVDEWKADHEAVALLRNEDWAGLHGMGFPTEGICKLPNWVAEAIIKVCQDCKIEMQGNIWDHLRKVINRLDETSAALNEVRKAIKHLPADC